MKKFWKSSLICLVSILLNACGLSPVKTYPTTYYQLNTDNTTVPSYQTRRYQSNNTLFVSKPTANAGYENNSMVYVVQPYQLRSYVYNQWVDSPANMLLNVFTDYLQRSNYFHAITFPPTSSLANYRLDTQIIMFQQEFLQPISQFHLVVQATLTNNATHKIIATKRFGAVVDAPGNDPYSGVVAANQAANQVAMDITQFCVRSIR